MGFSDLFRTVSKESSPEQAILNEQFLVVFGQHPQRRDFEDFDEYRVAVSEYDQKQKFFKGLSFPTAREETALEHFSAWNFGPGIMYEGRYSRMVHWPFAETGVEDMQAIALVYPALYIAGAQSRAIEHGKFVTKVHPYVPPRLRQKNDENRPG